VEEKWRRSRREGGEEEGCEEEADAVANKPGNEELPS
jgi:hypothetical protein